MPAEPAFLPTGLPAGRRVLAVCAHPDDESFGLGAVLSAFAEAGAEVGVLCLTPGEASTLGADEPDLATTRAAELAAAAAELGVARTWLLCYPDSGLARQPLGQVADEVGRVIDDQRPDLLVVFHPDGITGHPDHQQATRAALHAAGSDGLAVWAWYVPARVATRLNAELGTAFVATPPAPADLRVPVDRARQRRAIALHRSQQGSLPVVERRLELLGPVEHLRALRGEARRDPR